MEQLIAQARPDILWADIYHTTGTVKNKTCIHCKEKITPVQPTITPTTNGCNSTVCSPCFDNFLVREREANRHFTCPYCEITYKLRPQFGPPLSRAMTFNQNLQNTNWMLKTSTYLNNDARLNKGRLPGDEDYVDARIMRRNRRIVFDLAQLLHGHIRDHNERMKREEGKACIYSHCPASWFGMLPEARALVEKLELENLQGQTTPHTSLRKNTVDMLTEPDMPGWVMEQQIEMGVKLFAEWFCEYDCAVESAREKGKPLTWIDETEEEDEFYTTYEWADMIEGYVEGVREGPPLNGKMLRSKYRTETNIREAVAGEIVNEYMLNDYYGWRGPDEMVEQTSRMGRTG